MASNRRYLLAAAIHIGENHSTYAWSLVNDFEKNPLEKVSLPIWHNGLLTNKVSTCVLFTKDKKYQAFGYDAEEQYSNLVLEEKQGDYYFFRRFKMKMFNQIKSTRNVLIEDETGKTLSAIDVVAACIKYLSDHLIATLSNRVSGISGTDVRWVLTFPSTQNMLYKHFMQKAAIKAGIKDEQLFIVSEPEAASLFGHYHLLHDREKAGNFVLFVPNTKYLVLDAGDDSVDITAYDVQENNSLKQISTVRYEDCGGTFIDNAFISLLADIFGSDVMENLKTEQKEDYLDLLRDFDIKKHTITNTTSERVTFRIPPSMLEDFKQMNGKSIAEHIKTKPQYKERVRISVYKLRIDAYLVKDLYTGTCEIIIGHLKQIFEKDFYKDIATILMVGGFSGSLFLQSVIKETFPDKKIIIPEYPELAIVKGTVMFGHNPAVINMDVRPGYVPTRFSEK